MSTTLSPNEAFAVDLLRILGDIAGVGRDGLVTVEGRPAWGDVELLQARASSGERALIDAFYSAWACQVGGITHLLVMVDKGRQNEVLDVLTKAYRPFCVSVPDDSVVAES